MPLTLTRATKPQLTSLLRVYNRNRDVASSYRAFRRAAVLTRDCLMVHWFGMWLGIETDGYTHS